MRDYEMVELKLSIALEEGSAGRGLTQSVQETVIERLLPGMHSVNVPARVGRVRFVVLTDDFDLTLLGFPVGRQSAAILLHDTDLAILTAHGMPVNTAGFERREALGGWWFSVFPWNDSRGVVEAVGRLLPNIGAFQGPASFPFDV